MCECTHTHTHIHIRKVHICVHINKEKISVNGCGFHGQLILYDIHKHKSLNEKESHTY